MNNDVKNLSSVLRFGAFEVAFESRELRKHGMRIQLEEKPFQILEMLIESAGHVVKRKALCEKLWPDTYVAFDHSLNTAVNKLRSILGDLAQSPRFIETRPRLGYCFIAPVERLNGDRRAVALHPANGGKDPAVQSSEQVGGGQIKGRPARRSSHPQRVQAPPLPEKSYRTAP